MLLLPGLQQVKVGEKMIVGFRDSKIIPSNISVPSRLILCIYSVVSIHCAFYFERWHSGMRVGWKLNSKSLLRFVYSEIRKIR